MIYVQKKKEDINRYLRDICFFTLKPVLIIGLVILVSMTYCLLIGLLVDKKLLKMGIELSILFIVLCVILLRMVLFYKKMLNNQFLHADSENEIKYEITLDGSEYAVRNITNNTVERFRKEDIKRFKKSKYSILIKTVDNKLHFFPKKDELIEFFGI